MFKKNVYLFNKQIHEGMNEDSTWLYHLPRSSLDQYYSEFPKYPYVEVWMEMLKHLINLQ